VTNLFDLKNKRALITGASSGLGPYIAKQLDAAGASVIVHYYQNQAGAESLAAALNNPSFSIQADLTKAEKVVDLFQHSAPLDILINCAAAESQSVADLSDIDTKRWRETQQTNVEAPLILLQRLAVQDRAASVVNISSIEGTRPASGHGHYSTSKAALEMLTKSAALEFGSKNIRVNAIAPGLIWREGIEDNWPEGVAAWQDAAPLGRLIRPEQIASAVLFLCSSAAENITGTVLTIDAGLSVKSGW